MTKLIRPHDTLRRLTSYASVGVAAALIVAKLLAFFQTHSIALLSSLVDSSMDLLASLITAYGVAHAMRPADKQHRFGHGKAESLAALAQSAFIVGASVLLLIEAFQRIRVPQPITGLAAGYGVMGLAIFLTVLLLGLQTYTIRKTNSMAIASDRLHYVGDVLINLAVIATFALQEALGLLWVDPLFAIFIALSMLWGASKIGRRSMDVLMDAELPERDRVRILSLAQGVTGVKGVHDLRTRFDSDKAIIEMHVEMCPRLTLMESHDIADDVTEAVRQKYPRADILIHQDPKGVVEPRLDTEIEIETRKQDVSPSCSIR